MVHLFRFLRAVLVAALVPLAGIVAAQDKAGADKSAAFDTGANDAARTLAENIAGKEQRFVEMMNAHACALGLTSTEFRNGTGFTAEGQVLVGSAMQEGRRVIVAIAGLDTVQERSQEARKLIEWGFRWFDIRTLFGAGIELGDLSVYGGVIARARDAVMESSRQVARNGWQWGVEKARSRTKPGEPDPAKTGPQKPAEAGKAKT